MSKKSKPLAESVKREQLVKHIRKDLWPSLIGEYDSEYCYPWPYKMEIKSERQVVRMRFMVDNEDEEIAPKQDWVWWVSLYIGHDSDADKNMDGLSTGTGGMRGLLIAKQMLIWFIVMKMDKGQKIVIHPYDSRRRKVYEKVLTELGFFKCKYMKMNSFMFKKDWE